MKKLSTYFLIALGTLLFFACGNDGDAARDNAIENAGGSTPPATTTPTPNITPNDVANPTPPAPKEPPQNAAGVWHYTCPNGCAGGAGSAVPCPTCGTTLAHNTGYHAGATPPTEALPTPGGNANLTPVPAPTPGNPTPKPAEPAQNAAGVWHYTCPNGCAGGAGTASACAKCGTTLAHNTAYHQ